MAIKLPRVFIAAVLLPIALGVAGFVLFLEWKLLGVVKIMIPALIGIGTFLGGLSAAERLDIVREEPKPMSLFDNPTTEADRERPQDPLKPQ